MFGVPNRLIGPDRSSAEIIRKAVDWMAAVMMASGAGLGADAVDDVGWCQIRSCRGERVLDACAKCRVRHRCVDVPQERRAYVAELDAIQVPFVAFKSVVACV